jgi:hypothetical protein
MMFAVALFGVFVPSLSQAKTEYLKEAPKDGEIPYGKVVYVDDGTCPKGEIKEVTGGSREKSIPRKSRCVKRPIESTKETNNDGKK